MNNVGYMWELDLVDMTSLASHNDGHNYIHNAIDAFSKYAYTMSTRSIRPQLSEPLCPEPETEVRWWCGVTRGRSL